MNLTNQWVQPIPLRGNRSNLIDFPVNTLPPILREMAFAFPMANTIPWLHYSEALREPIKPMAVSYLYFAVWIMIGIVANVIAVKKANVIDCQKGYKTFSYALTLNQGI